MKSFFASFAVVAGLLGAPAFAADMAMKAPVAPASTLDPWTGFYVGGNVGYEWLHSAAYGISPDPGTLGQFQLTGVAYPGALSSNRAVGGVQIGYNWRLQSNWLVGLEADFQDSDATARATALSASGFGTNNFANTASPDWFGTVRLRAGRLFTPSTFAYATGGFAYGRTFRTTFVNYAQPPPGFGCFAGAGCAIGGSANQNSTGWAAGGGFEQQISNSKFSLGVEYLYVELNGGSLNASCLNAACTAPPVGRYSASAGKLDAQILRLKLNAHF